MAGVLQNRTAPVPTRAGDACRAGFLTNWNDFLWSIYVLFSPDRLTLPPGLGLLQSAYTIDYPVIMTGGVIASIPVLILFIVAQRYVIEGVARTGLKG
jgi:multiple sugar transport system permease protein